MSAPRDRLDVLMVKKDLASTREKAKLHILSGEVFVDNVKVVKPGSIVNTDSDIKVVSHSNSFVGRGGIKLEKALKDFSIDVEQKVFVDVGASTGGFTDCLLKYGASKVYALDVGYGQLAWKLRCDERVVVMERINVRHTRADMFHDKLDGATIDVSFISLKLVLPIVEKLLDSKSEIIALIKPQFEAGKGKVGKKGVVNSVDTHVEVLTELTRFCSNLGLSIVNLTYSPLKGPSGNIEFLLHLKKGFGEGCNFAEDWIKQLVIKAHTELK